MLARGLFRTIAARPALRQFSQRAGSGTGANRHRYRHLLPFAAGTCGVAAALLLLHRQRSSLLPVAAAASAELAPSGDNVQPTVFSETKDHALYLTIHLNSGANKREVAKIAAKVQQLVDEISPPDMRDEADELWAGVGFGYAFFSAVMGKPQIDFSCQDRRGAFGEMPSTGGDIFIHAKSNEVSKLYELCQAVTAALPPSSIAYFEDVYSFVYRNGRDLSGFIDGTENPADDESRMRIAIAPGGGSYAITQKWVHDFNKIKSYKEAELESFIGRTLPDSTELHRKSISSHVARMTGGNNFEQKKRYEIVRQSMPFGSVSGDSGLFFIAYAASPNNFNWMLDRMVGKAGDQHSDDVMRISRCVQGTYWYFPSLTELAALA